MEGTEFLEYLELQDNLDMVSKSDLLESVRTRGGRVTDRQLTTYISEGLVPRSARIGSRSGAFPKIVVDLLHWIDNSRQRGLAVEAIKELVPLWKFLMRAVRAKDLNLTEFEYVARQFVRSPEAGFAVPNLFDWCLPCPYHDNESLAAIQVTLKDGRVIDPASDSFIPLAFTLFEDLDDGEEPLLLAHTRYAIPLGYDHISDAIILGLPNGVEVPVEKAMVELGRGGSTKELGPSNKEVYATEGG